MLYIEKQYVNRIRISLENFKEINHNPYVVNFRCPICGDSKKSKRKARGYIYEHEGILKYKCWNCDASMPFWIYLQEYHNNIYLQYKMDWLKNQYVETKQENEPKFITHTHFDYSLGEKAINLPNDHILIEYIQKRKIPEKFWNSIYFINDINDITKQFINYKNIDFSKEPVMIIPIYTKDRDYSYVILRTINKKSSFRYMVLQKDDKHPKIWGIEFIDYTKPIYILEGAIDAMMIDNSLAIIGTSRYAAISFLKERVNKNDIIFIYDNEYFNKQVLSVITKTIDEGYSVVLFNRFFPSKDINDAVVKHNWSKEKIQQYLQNRTFNGLRAKTELSFQLKYNKL